MQSILKGDLIDKIKTEHMPAMIMILTSTYISSSTLLLVSLALLLAWKLYVRAHRSKLELFYSKENKLMKDFV